MSTVTKKRSDNVQTKMFKHFDKDGKESIVLVCLEPGRPTYVGFPVTHSKESSEVPLAEYAPQLFEKNPKQVYRSNVVHLENISLVLNVKMAPEIAWDDCPTPEALFNRRPDFSYPKGKVEVKANDQNVEVVINGKVIRTFGERLPLEVEFQSLLNVESQFCIKGLEGFSLPSVIAAFEKAQVARIGTVITKWAEKAATIMAAAPTSAMPQIPGAVAKPTVATMPTIPGAPQVASLPQIPGAVATMPTIPGGVVATKNSALPEGWTIPPSKSLPSNFNSMSSDKKLKWLKKNATQQKTVKA